MHIKSFILWIVMSCLVSPIAAQNNPPSAVHASTTHEKSTRLILLGTGGGPVTSLYRSQPASLLVVDGRPYLIDVGDGTTKQLKLAGYDATDIGHVFFTHLHLDHTAGLAPLMALNWITGNRQMMQVYGPPGTSAMTRAAAEYLKIPSQIHGVVLPPHPPIADIATPHDLDIGDETLIFEDDRLRVFAVANSHYITTEIPSRSYGHDQAYSYRFETADRTIIFTGDTGPSAAIEKLARNADILVTEIIDVEATKQMLRRQFPVTDAQLEPLVAHMIKEHLVPEEVGKLASTAQVGMVVLSHVVPVTDERDYAPAFTTGVKKHFNGPVIMGQDLSEF